MKKFALALLLFLPFSAQAQLLDRPKTPASEFAVFAGKIAGSAEYCQYDLELREEYIGLAFARIANLAEDRIDQVVSQMEFSNNYSVTSTQAPRGGCGEFQDTFALELTKLK